MTLFPNPTVLDALTRDRQTRLRAVPPAIRRSTVPGRVRLGLALIAIGSSISGQRVERVERRSRHTTAGNPA